MKMHKGYYDRIVDLHFEQIEEHFGVDYLYAINALIEGYMKVFTKYSGNITDAVSFIKRLGEEVDESELSKLNLEALQVVNNGFEQLNEERQGDGSVLLDKYTFNYLLQNLALVNGNNFIEFA